MQLRNFAKNCTYILPRGCRSAGCVWGGGDVGKSSPQDNPIQNAHKLTPIIFLFSKLLLCFSQINDRQKSFIQILFDCFAIFAVVVRQRGTDREAEGMTEREISETKRRTFYLYEKSGLEGTENIISTTTT